MTPGRLFRFWATLVFPFSAEGTLVWWWRMHATMHGREIEPRCPFCTVGDD